jgi:chorismate synthase
LTAGESHGPALVATIDGLPAGVVVSSDDVARALARRRLGHGRGARMKFEQDEVTFLGGVRHGVTLGSPVAIRIGNSEWPKWQTVMSADPVAADEAYAAATTSTPRRRSPATGRSPGPAPATPTSSACRSTASTTPARPRAGLGPRDRRPGRAR